MNKNEIIAHLENVIDTAETCRNAYFWTPGGTASSRRRNESRRNIPAVEFEIGKDTWEIGYSYSESCSNVYASGAYYRNGKKTTLTAVRNLLKKLEVAA